MTGRKTPRQVTPYEVVVCSIKVVAWAVGRRCEGGAGRGELVRGNLGLDVP